MNRLINDATATPEPELPAAQSAGAGRTSLYLVLSALLLAGGWMRFHDQILSLYPEFAPKTTAAPVVEAGIRAVVELNLLSPTEAAAALPGLALSPTDQAALADQMKRGRIGLVRMPIFDAGATGPDDVLAGRSVLVSSGGYTRLVPLQRAAVTVVLPIDRVGNVSFQTASADSVGIGVVTVGGPVPLPPIVAGDRLDIGVVAQ